jgi:four helix bundle protein
MGVRSYKDLVVWKKAMGLTVEVYRITEGFPKRETYGLVSQMRRAAVSIVSNIAEGHARNSTRDYLHHISFARGSAAELETQLLLSVELGYLTEEKAEHALDECTQIGKMLRTIQESLLERLDSLAPSP